MRRPSWTRRSGCVWAAAGSLAGLVLLALLLLLSALIRSASGRQSVTVPVVTVVPRPTATMAVIVLPSAIPTETQAPLATSDPGRLSVGGLAEVYGTEGDGLRLRQEPSTSATIKLLAGESEVFIVQEGPVDADGRVWFLLVSPSDSARAGWAVADFLRPAQ